MPLKLSALAASLAVAAFAAHAGEPHDPMTSFVDATVRGWLATPSVQAAIAASNAAHAGLSEAQLIKRDAAWRAEIGQTKTPTIDAILQSPVSGALRAHVADSGGRITEIILMDNRGMNVAVSDVTSDFWQGDEAKFQQTFPRGPAALHVSEVELDESSQIYQAQVSFTVTDAQGAPVGAVTIGLNAEAF
ncbi:hypothetical protein [Seohaeicola zhoushanensis]|nr:hypothetical protein [Seohaeicola zhoushanensis]